ncbi:arylacetamide deacetylase-like isoform X2 [Branchiostoma floridae]|nr:arylacetamide deacetylase-like isoform X2 [Branchiostoma floridae]
MGALGVLTWLTAAGTLGAAVFAGYLYSSLPPDVAEPRKVFIIKGFERTFYFVGWVCEKMGFSARAPQPPPQASHPNLEVTDTSFDGVRVRVYKPQGQEPGSKMAGLMWFHGGGWVIGSVDGYDALVGHIANQTGAVVVSVEYRLAPEHKFPIPFEDCLTATQHFLQHASEYGVDPTRIGVAGDSAGGNLAAAVALRLKKNDKKKFLPLKLQALIYPALQAFDFQTPSYVSGHKFFVLLPVEMMTGFWIKYLNNNMSLVDMFANNEHTAALKKSRFASFVERHFLDDSVPRLVPEDVSVDLPDDMKDLLNPYYSPLMAEDADLSGLPNTYVTVCGTDVLRDDGIMYARRLEMAGVQVRLARYPSGFHGIMSFSSKPFYLEVGKQMLQDLTTFLRHHL